MVGWHHWINGLEFEQTPEDNERQGSLACCSPRGRKQVDVTEWLKNNSNDSSTRQRANLSHSTGRLLGFKGAVFSALGICEYEMNLFFSFPILRMRTIPGKHRQWCSGDGWPSTELMSACLIFSYPSWAQPVSQRASPALMMSSSIYHTVHLAELQGCSQPVCKNEFHTAPVMRRGEKITNCIAKIFFFLSSIPWSRSK